MNFPFNDFQMRRCKRLLHEYREHFRLDLNGLSVFTEAASGWYMFTPAMCALAGARRVHALARDSRYGTAAEIIVQSRELMRSLGCENVVEFYTEKTSEALADADIVMNSGAVRPIDAQTVSILKSTAVIPLMWETWEFRPAELDLAACQKNGILVMGTDEITLDRFPFSGYLPMKLLFQCGIEIFKNKLLLIGSGRPGQGMARVFHNNGFDFRWISFDDEAPAFLTPYHLSPSDSSVIEEWAASADAIVCFEHVYKRPIIAKGGLILPEFLQKYNNSGTLIFISGVIDYERIKELDLFIYPDRYVPFGTMSIGTWEMGPRAIIELTMAGIKVGEAMAKARISGFSLTEAAHEAQKESLAQDFPGKNSWIRGKKIKE